MINRNKNRINKNRWNYQEVETSFWLQKVKSGDRFYLSKAISLVESTHQSDLREFKSLQQP